MVDIFNSIRIHSLQVPHDIVSRVRNSIWTSWEEHMDVNMMNVTFTTTRGMAGLLIEGVGEGIRNSIEHLRSIGGE